MTAAGGSFAQATSMQTVMHNLIPSMVMGAAAYGDEGQFWWALRDFPNSVSGLELVSVRAQGGDPSYLCSSHVFVVAFRQLGHVGLFFRGSSEDANYLTDSDVALVPFNNRACPGGCLVHRGIQAAFEAVANPANADSITASLDRLTVQPPTRIICGGHSLGGSLATLCGPWAKSMWPQASVAVHSMGAMRVGNEAFARFFDALVDESFRVMHNQDPIPGFPAEDLGYRHVATPVWLMRHNDSTYSAAFRDQVLEERIAQDHMTDPYIQVVRNLSRDDVRRMPPAQATTYSAQVAG
eukprot:jgi/Botrbrau1/13238/Bobra.0199s0010.1